MGRLNAPYPITHRHEWVDHKRDGTPPENGTSRHVTTMRCAVCGLRAMAASYRMPNGRRVSFGMANGRLSHVQIETNRWPKRKRGML